MLKIRKTNKKVDQTLSKLGSQVALVDEKDETEARIVAAIRQRYSLSEELALNRKKNMGTVDPAEWQAFVDYVEECIEAAKD